jgi:ribosomal protein L22
MFKRLYSTASSLLDAAVKDASTAIGLKGASKQTKIPVFTTGNMKTSPKKLTLLARVIKGMSIKEAEGQMKMSIKKRGIDIFNMLRRARSVLSHNYGQDYRQYYIKQAWVGKGTYLKRIKIHGRGRTGKMTRPSAHIKVILAKKDPNPDGMNEKQALEFKKLVKIFKRNKLFDTIKDSKPIYNPHLPWSKKPWKYITSPKWVESRNAFMNSSKPRR